MTMTPFIFTSSHAEQSTQFTPTQIDRPFFSSVHWINSSPKEWGLEQEDWDAYQHLQQGEAGLYYAHMEPAFVLAMYADDPADRQRYMEIFVRRDDARRQRLFDTNREYRLMQKTLFPGRKKFDEELLSAWNAVAESNPKPSPAFSHVDRQRIYITIHNCDTCQQIVKDRINQNLPFDLFFLDAATDLNIQSWAQQVQIPMDKVNSGVITLNYSDIDLATINPEQIPLVLPGIDKY